MEDEEYEPEHPEIFKRNRTDEPGKVYKLVDTTWYDEEGFFEACVGVCISRYPSGMGRMIEVAGYGIWFSDGNVTNANGVLDRTRPQSIKPVMIRGSAHAIEIMKRAGYSRVRINLETDYLNQNVISWIFKYMHDPKAKPENWDEFKYQTEIQGLCTTVSGMIIKWSHLSDGSMKTSGLQKAKILAKKATDDFIADFKHRQGAVGTSCS